MTYPDDGGYRGAPRKFRGRCGAVWPGKGGWRATRRYRGRPAHIGNNRRERERGKAKSRKLALLCFASLRLTSLTTLPCFLAHLIITAGCGCCITRVCIFFVFSLQLPCDLSTLHLTEHSIQVFLARFPFDRPLSSSIWCQRRSKYRSQTRRPKQRYRGELRVRAVCADRTM